MRITVLGGCGAWPEAGQACSGLLVTHDGFALVVDLGYATLPRLLAYLPAERVDAVLVSHGHPDHCADLNPLLRARVLGAAPPAPLPVYALPGALDAVLALEPSPRMLAGAHDLCEFTGGETLHIGPFEVETRLLPHFVPNAGFRISAGTSALTYTGDTGPCADVVTLAEGADLVVAEATHPWQVPAGSAEYLTSAHQAGRQARDADAVALMLTHLWPGTDPVLPLAAARESFAGPLSIATSGAVIDLP